MRNLLYILFTVCLFTACSSDDDNEPTQDYTSFVVIYNANIDKLPNCVSAYKKDGKFYKIAELGDLVKGKYSSEIIINNKSVNELYIFSDYMNVIRFDDVYELKMNKKNTITIKDGTDGIKVTDKSDPNQYPQ